MLAHLAARGPCRLGDLAAEAGVTQPTASDAVAALIRKRLIDKRPDPNDGRASVFVVAPSTAHRHRAPEERKTCGKEGRT